MTTDPIFPDQNEPEERPTDYIANPVRVQLPKYDARAEGRRWTQMDLVALANNILARETECASLRQKLGETLIKLSALERRMDTLDVLVKSSRTSSPGGKLGRILTAIEKILSEDDDEDEYDPY
jgi:hypothetical protein